MSLGTGRRYPLTMVCEVWRVARSTVYTMRPRGLGSEVGEPRKRGPKTEITDEELVSEIRGVLRESDFLGEGHRKVRACLRPKGIRVGKNRVQPRATSRDNITRWLWRTSDWPKPTLRPRAGAGPLWNADRGWVPSSPKATARRPSPPVWVDQEQPPRLGHHPHDSVTFGRRSRKEGMRIHYA